MRGPGSLLARREVAFAGANGEIFLQRTDFNATVAAIGIELSRLVGNDVLAAQLILDGDERARNILVLEWRERPTAGGIR